MIKSLASLILAAASSAPVFAGGIPDPGFGDKGFAFLVLDGIEGHELHAGVALPLPDGSLLFGGSRNLRVPGNPDPHVRAMLARMHADGSPDDTFNTNPAIPGIRVMDDLVSGTGSQQIEAMRRLVDGSIVAVGTAQAFGPLTCFAIKLDANGERDMTFGGEGLASIPRAHCHAAVVDAAGRIVVAGEQLTEAGSLEAFLGRFDATGHLDTTFGNEGIAALTAVNEGESGYINALALSHDGSLIAGGSYEAYGPGMGADFSLARFDADGHRDATFAGTGWRVFHADGDASTFNGVERLLIDADGSIVFAGHRIDAMDSVQIVLAAIAADGTTDTTFGAAGSGFVQIDFAAGASARYVTGLARQVDGHLVASAREAVAGKSEFVAFRVDARGELDADFGDHGIASLDLAPSGVYSDATALTLQDDVPIVAGSVKRDPASQLVDLGVVRLVSAKDDAIFGDGFDEAPAAAHITTYDDLAEGFLGNSFDHDGIHYHDCNGLDGVFPDGATFTAADIGDTYIIEDAALFYSDFPMFGSAPNVLTFGDGYINGDNFSIGALTQAFMDLDAPAVAARFDLAYYENGPWGGIVLHLDALRSGNVVASDSLTIANGGGRDNIATTSLHVEGVMFDGLRLYATYNGQPSAPRVMIDNLAITPAQ